ncbi:MAG: hypothetical protein WA373_02820 [Burkholderiales bacterium]
MTDQDSLEAVNDDHGHDASTTAPEMKRACIMQALEESGAPGRN